LVGLSALSWVLLIPAVAVWPLAGLVIYLIWRWAKRSTEADEAQRKALLDAAAKPPEEPPG
jgi:membrane protein implicated in regulation of membrane protease activity